MRKFFLVACFVIVALTLSVSLVAVGYAAVDGNEATIARFSAIFKTSPSTLADGDYDVLHTDAHHGLMIGGQVAAGSAIAGNPLQTGVSDGTDIRALLGDQNGVAYTAVPKSGWYVAANTADTAAQTPSASEAAGATGVKHVCTGVHAVIFGDGTGNADHVILNLRDGATGAGTIVEQWQLVLGTGANANGTILDVSDLKIVGTAATAMTLELAGASASHSIVTCSMTGYDFKP